MTLEDFKAFLTALRDETGAQLCGSFARHEQDLRSGFLSDIDLVIRHADLEYQRRPIDQAIEIFKRFGVKGNSIMIGQWSSPRDTETLPRPVEVMTHVWIDPDPTLEPEITVYGVVFKTYRKTF